MDLSHQPLLSILIGLPLLAASVLAFTASTSFARVFALIVSGGELALSVLVLCLFDPAETTLQLTERHRWIPSLHIDYAIGIDGLSVLFLPATALLSLLVVLSTGRAIERPRLYFGLLLLLEGVTQGIFVATDLGLFFLFWELTLPPLFLLISLWGIGPQRRHAAAQYTLFMLAGGIPILIGFVLLGLYHADALGLPPPHGLSFDYRTLLDTPLPLEMQSAVFILLFLGFAIKAPVVPLHAWLPTVAMEGPPGITAILVGLKLGLYGILRFAIPLAPQAANLYLPWVIGLGVAGAWYGALVALGQTNLRRVLAFSSVSHVGFALIGIASLNAQGVQGSVFMILNFSLVASGLFLLAGYMHRRFGSTEFHALGGVARTMPRMTAAFFVLGLASLGVPLTSGFAAEHLVLIGAFKANAGLGVGALIAVILGAAYFLRCFRLGFLGPVNNPAVGRAADLHGREIWVVLPTLVLAIALGLFPQYVLLTVQSAVSAWVVRVEHGYSSTLASVQPLP